MATYLRRKYVHLTTCATTDGHLISLKSYTLAKAMRSPDTYQATLKHALMTNPSPLGKLYQCTWGDDGKPFSQTARPCASCRRPEVCQDKLKIAATRRTSILCNWTPYGALHLAYWKKREAEMSISIRGWRHAIRRGVSSIPRQRWSMC